MTENVKTFAPGERAYSLFCGDRQNSLPWNDLSQDGQTSWHCVEIGLERYFRELYAKPPGRIHFVPGRRTSSTDLLEQIARSIGMKPGEFFAKAKPMPGAAGRWWDSEAQIWRDPPAPSEPAKPTAAADTRILGLFGPDSFTLKFRNEWVKDTDQYGRPTRIEIPADAIQETEIKPEPANPPMAQTMEQHRQDQPKAAAGASPEIPENARLDRLANLSREARARADAERIVREQITFYRAFGTVFGHSADDSPMLRHITLKVERVPSYMDALIAQLAFDLGKDVGDA